MDASVWIEGSKRLKYFLGIEIIHSRIGLILNWRKYTHDLIKETWKLGCATPIEVNHKVNIKNGEHSLMKENVHIES